MLNNTITEYIDKVYGYGKYYNSTIIVYLPCGYVNATHLCNTICKNRQKNYNKWYESSIAVSVIGELALSLGVAPSSLTFTKNSQDILNGVYVHPGLVPIIASWASPAFALQMGYISNSIAVQTYINTLYKEARSLVDNIENSMKIHETTPNKSNCN
jgi:hypothetical protein